jgi:hypothetical protein
MPELAILPKLSRQQIVVCRPHTLVCNGGDRRSNAQDAAISGERFSPSRAIHPATKRHVRPAGDQDEDFAPRTLFVRRANRLTVFPVRISLGRTQWAGGSPLPPAHIAFHRLRQDRNRTARPSGRAPGFGSTSLVIIPN